MCGLFGWYFKDPDNRLIPAAALLSVAMDSRGGQSWGYYDGEDIVKGLGAIHRNIRAQELGTKPFLLAHTRSATVGAVTIPNAHPFEFGSIIGAHNGSIPNYEALNKRYERKFEVDSMHVFAHLNEDKPLSDLLGWGALTWIDDRQPGKMFYTIWNGTLCMARIYEDDKKENAIGMLWGSTEDAVRAALEVSGFKFNIMHSPERKLNWIENTEDDGICAFHTKERLPFGDKPVEEEKKASKSSFHGPYVAPRASSQEKEEIKALGSGAKISHLRPGNCESCNLRTQVGWAFAYGTLLCPACVEDFDNAVNLDKENAGKDAEDQTNWAGM